MRVPTWVLICKFIKILAFVFTRNEQKIKRVIFWNGAFS